LTRFYKGKPLTAPPDARWHPGGVPYGLPHRKAIRVL
jgi:hypothetical protein